MIKDLKQYNDTLFLDRDGVINVQIPNDYVKSPEEFKFIEGAGEALRILSEHFQLILIVSNQRGVGKGLMTDEDLIAINDFMMDRIYESGGRIDRIYTCTDTDEHSKNRKPNIGMALQAREDFPNIAFSRSLMVGDSISDIQFANNACIPAILLGNKYNEEDLKPVEILCHFDNLLSLAKALQ